METETRDSASWQNYRASVNKTAKLENIIQSLSSPVKKKVVKSVQSNFFLAEIFVHTDADSIYEAKVTSLLNKHLKALNLQKTCASFHSLLDKIFGLQLQDENFLNWLASRL